MGIRNKTHIQNELLNFKNYLNKRYAQNIIPINNYPKICKNIYRPLEHDHNNLQFPETPKQTIKACVEGKKKNIYESQYLYKEKRKPIYHIDKSMRT